MTRNRRHKARIRARQQATGERYTQAARHTDHGRRPIGELLEQAAAGLHAAEVTDTDAVLQAAWDGMCTIGAAGQLLSACADPGHYPACWLPAEPVLAEAIRALRATPALRGISTEINPAGGPDDRLDDAAALDICRSLAETADTLSATLSDAAEHAQARAARRACRAGAAAGLRVAAIYRAEPARQPTLPRLWRTLSGCRRTRPRRCSRSLTVTGISWRRPTRAILPLPWLPHGMGLLWRSCSASSWPTATTTTPSCITTPRQSWPESWKSLRLHPRCRPGSTVPGCTPRRLRIRR